MTDQRTVRAVAPASVSNLGPGFDILGCAVDGPSDSVVATRTDKSGIVVAEAGHPELPTDPSKHASAIAAAAVLRIAGMESIGLELRVTKGIPLSGGQGGSAASAVAGALAVNALLGYPLDESSLLESCLVAEDRVAGRHADNVAASLFGGIILVLSLQPLDVVRLPVPSELRVVVVHPNQRMNTREARAVIPSTFSREILVSHAAHAAALVAGFTLGDYSLISRALVDSVAEPYRAPLLPGFTDAKSAALASGALGASISGSGPTSFALVRGDATAARVAAEMARAYRDRGIECDARVSRIRGGAAVDTMTDARPGAVHP
jgi:homoserine kinase